MRILFAATALLSLLLLAGCAARPVQPETGIDWDRRADLLAGESAWHAHGRIAFKAGKDGGSGSMSWKQAGEDARITLSGPFGAGAYEIAWDDERIVVTSKKGEQVAAYTGRDAADRFLEAQLGWSFPARSIRYWLLGVADPEFTSARRFDDDGWLAGIEQNGW
ncbi:MAG: outer membrane lipoprotein LolB, partial [Gammaproteobacteria bacterium]|nr:outer membrane lipoprotein LolB [Gammaproteobacteria bacterium]